MQSNPHTTGHLDGRQMANLPSFANPFGAMLPPTTDNMTARSFTPSHEVLSQMGSDAEQRRMPQHLRAGASMMPGEMQMGDPESAQTGSNPDNWLMSLQNLKVPPPQGMSSRRRSQHQLEVLESVFKLCPNPSEARRKQLGGMLKMDERQVMIWFQNKRQRVKAKAKEQENGTLREQHNTLKVELDQEKNRERALKQENALLKAWMDSKKRKMEDLRKEASKLLVNYYDKKGKGEEWKKALPAGLAEALKLGMTGDADESKLKEVLEKKDSSIDNTTVTAAVTAVEDVKVEATAAVTAVEDVKVEATADKGKPVESSS